MFRGGLKEFKKSLKYLALPRRDNISVRDEVEHSTASEPGEFTKAVRELSRKSCIITIDRHLRDSRYFRTESGSK